MFLAGCVCWSGVFAAMNRNRAGEGAPAGMRSCRSGVLAAIRGIKNNRAGDGAPTCLLWMWLAGRHDRLQLANVLLQTLHCQPVSLLYQLRHDNDYLLPGGRNVEVINGLQFFFRDVCMYIS